MVTALEHWTVGSPKGSTSIASPAAWRGVDKSTPHVQQNMIEFIFWLLWGHTKHEGPLCAQYTALHQCSASASFCLVLFQCTVAMTKSGGSCRRWTLITAAGLSCESRQESLFSAWGRCSSAMEKNYSNTLPARKFLKLHRSSNCWVYFLFFFFLLFFSLGLNFHFCSQTITIILCNGICSCLLVSCCVSFAAVWCT